MLPQSFNPCLGVLESWSSKKLPRFKSGPIPLLSTFQVARTEPQPSQGRRSWNRPPHRQRWFPPRGASASPPSARWAGWAGSEEASSRHPKHEVFEQAKSSDNWRLLKQETFQEFETICFKATSPGPPPGAATVQPSEFRLVSPKRWPASPKFLLEGTNLGIAKPHGHKKNEELASASPEVP